MVLLLSLIATYAAYSLTRLFALCLGSVWKLVCFQRALVEVQHLHVAVVSYICSEMTL